MELNYYDKQSVLRRYLKRGLNSVCEFCSVSLVIYLYSINIILVVCSNMTLLNPGPVCKRKISVYYQNIQGLIPFTHINSENPPLNLTKLAELHTYVAFNKPDIVILNETWLKENIGSKEIFPFPNYKIFRLDRSPFSHPPDEIGKRKFKSNGGGVLIAVNSDVVTNHKVIKSNSRDEVLSISFDIAWGKEICITTCYRVGTLGHDNLNEISKHINIISNTTSIKSHILVRDFNLNAVSWDQLSSTIKLQNDFLIMFENNCLTQMISQPTHYLGNVLDILLTDKPSIISNLNIGDHKEVVSSDHYPISFHVLTTLVTKKVKQKKCKIYNFKKANWKAINEQFAKTNWNTILDGKDAHLAWRDFKLNFFSVIDNHIPKISLRDSQNPPWFDSDLHKLCRKKERLRASYNENKDPKFHKKFCEARKELKNAVKVKMRANFENFEKPNSITKKFWSYAKSASNTSSIRDRVFYNDKHTNCPTKKTTLFNEYFYKQFSEKSSYNVHIDFQHDQF